LVMTSPLQGEDPRFEPGRTHQTFPLSCKGIKDFSGIF
jgi:hypothetical protein